MPRTRAEREALAAELETGRGTLRVADREALARELRELAATADYMAEDQDHPVRATLGSFRARSGDATERAHLDGAATLIGVLRAAIAARDDEIANLRSRGR